MTEIETPIIEYYEPQAVAKLTPSVSTPLNRRHRTDIRDTQAALHVFAAKLHEDAKRVQSWTAYSEQGKRDHWAKQSHGQTYTRLCQHVVDLLGAAELYPQEVLEEVLKGTPGTAEEQVAAELKAQRMMGRGEPFTADHLVDLCINGDAAARVVLEELTARGHVEPAFVHGLVEQKHDAYADAMRVRHRTQTFVNSVFKPFLADLSGMVGNHHVAASTPATMPVNVAQALDGEVVEVIGVQPVKL